MQAPDRISLVLRAPEGGTLEKVVESARLCSSVRVGINESLAVIAGASEGDLQEAVAEREALLEEVLNEVPHGWGASFSDSDLAKRIRAILGIKP
ncbi:hypothetical protein [Pseudomonas asplenii]|uniref:Uncharacterized protein n=1 Tax=Pseudomonas asplenii TaxID=53407 RepID=A0A1H6PDE4_9PSED|nr:hypothetical protein [Pseudomonas fuscovaginae]SEI23666.1 hypothetical protein SAMN05216581_5258 [Pseudomonas fuscovaginae]